MHTPALSLIISGSLGIVALASTIGIFALEFQGKQSNGALTAIASTCIGSLASFLTRPPLVKNGHHLAGKDAEPTHVDVL